MRVDLGDELKSRRMKFCDTSRGLIYGGDNKSVQHRTVTGVFFSVNYDVAFLHTAVKELIRAFG